MVRWVFRPYTQIRRSICTSEPLRASTRVSSGFALFRHSSPSFGSQHACSNSYSLPSLGYKSTVDEVSCEYHLLLSLRTSIFGIAYSHACWTPWSVFQDGSLDTLSSIFFSVVGWSGKWGFLFDMIIVLGTSAISQKKHFSPVSLLTCKSGHRAYKKSYKKHSKHRNVYKPPWLFVLPPCHQLGLTHYRVRGHSIPKMTCTPFYLRVPNASLLTISRTV